ncbi:MAG: NADH-quinone oxidoreductase subunit J [Candidatus Eisenbacteria bacterium]|uniref:NADH-quinone oxidoreductase subunit J n=1 Tax=Eiseniibacteriota bacterium TaxID=2212470 RepID=A0A948W8P3_UNCEI|nr:NADH-quinone oxidoreductase subunit J [Candidatus Eisenbacteria bacterium]MBU1950293.1 NADH-quinone oxidoreductase subunit J [Candidatus Eisenbacteria bacterium]MBU2692891.1 NADH-quinone oxidoreductase subunit J [Candidatus Eisenbacteria bacterium]
MTGLPFYIFALISAIGAVLTVTRKNPLTGALCLALTMIGLAGLFLLLHGYLVFVLQILVYAGAVVVLIIFVIMMLNIREPVVRLQRLYWKRALPGGVLSLVLLYLLWRPLQNIPDFPPSISDSFGTVERVGVEIFTRYAFPFEVLSLVLLIAIVGAVVLAKKSED